MANKTALHEWHVKHGAKMAAFGGYDMPLWYDSGPKDEHLVVLTKAGLFDTSHMAAIMTTGSGAFNLLQRCFSKDLEACLGRNRSPLSSGRCVYGVFLNEKGHVIDDAIIFQLEPELYMIVVNAGMGGLITEHLISHTGADQVRITDLTDKLGKMDLQGPGAARIMAGILAEPESVFDKLTYFSFKGHFEEASPLAATVKTKDGLPLLLSRTGYTGEFGFEIFVQLGHFVALWEKILAAGQKDGLLTCGLAARDSLRAGAVLPLSHQDIGPWPFINHPWPFALPYDEDGRGFTKIFLGAQALLNLKKEEFTYPYVGFDPRKVTLDDKAVVLDGHGREIGLVLTCATEISLGWHEDRIYGLTSPDRPEGFKARGLCCGFIRVDQELPRGQIVELKDKRRKIKVMVVDDIRPHRTARLPIRDMF